jgi:hypothetical protein
LFRFITKKKKEINIFFSKKIFYLVAAAPSLFIARTTVSFGCIIASRDFKALISLN